MRTTILLAAALVLLLPVDRLAAQGYTYREVFSTDTDSLSAPTLYINSQGEEEISWRQVRPTGLQSLEITTLNGSAFSTSNPIPSGQGTFSGLAEPSIGLGASVSARGDGSGGQQGIYLGGSIGRFALADRNTLIPGGSGTFTFFSQRVAQSSNFSTYFTASGINAQAGAYRARGVNNVSVVADKNTLNLPGAFLFDMVTVDDDDVAFVVFQNSGSMIVSNGRGQFSTIVSTGNTIPGGSGNFLSLLNPAIVGDQVAFYGSGSGGQQGIYVVFSNGDRALFANTNTLIPEGTGSFNGFGFNPCMAGANLRAVFVGRGTSGQAGIYTKTPGGPTEKVVDVSDSLGGKNVTDLSIVSPCLAEDGRIAFRAAFSDGSQGIWVAEPCPVASTLDRAVSRRPALAGLRDRMLDHVRGFRDHLLRRSPAGRELTGLYYEHAAEVASILRDHPELKAEAFRLLVRGYLARRRSRGPGATLVLDRDAFEAGVRLLRGVEVHASPALTVALEQVRAFLDARSRSAEDAVIVDFGPDSDY